MDYVMAVQAVAFPATERSFFVEGPFGHHLKELKARLPAGFKRIILVAPVSTRRVISAETPGMMAIDHEADGIELFPAYDVNISLPSFWTGIPSLYRKAKALFHGLSILHVDLSTDFRRPMTAVIARAAENSGRSIMFVTDIDFRDHAMRARQLGAGLPKYAWMKAQEKFKSLQVRRAVDRYQLVLLKSPSMVASFGKGKPHIKTFYDVVHGDADLLSEQDSSERSVFLADPSRPLQLCYFGRLVEYKGLDRLVEAIAIASGRSTDVRLKIVGDGPALDGLKAQASSLGIAHLVNFRPAANYGEALFSELKDVHLATNTPLREDTPRSAFDAMARGLPIVAFDISYFSDLARESSAVVLADWPSAESLAGQIVALSNDRGRVASMSWSALAFAGQHTKQHWLGLRTNWFETYVVKRGA